MVCPAYAGRSVRSERTAGRRTPAGSPAPSVRERTGGGPPGIAPPNTPEDAGLPAGMRSISPQTASVNPTLVCRPRGDSMRFRVFLFRPERETEWLAGCPNLRILFPDGTGPPPMVSSWRRLQRLQSYPDPGRELFPRSSPIVLHPALPSCDASPRCIIYRGNLPRIKARAVAAVFAVIWATAAPAKPAYSRITASQNPNRRTIRTRDKERSTATCFRLKKTAVPMTVGQIPRRGLRFP